MYHFKLGITHALYHDLSKELQLVSWCCTVNIVTNVMRFNNEIQNYLLAMSFQKNCALDTGTDLGLLEGGGGGGLITMGGAKLTGYLPCF